MTTKSDKPKLRAVSYCRTSGGGKTHTLEDKEDREENKPGNTSIPHQKEDNERFIASQEGWQFIRHYVDESISGSKVEGRDKFQQMMRDAANNQFDVIVAWDISRFARDGVDIVGKAKFLKTNFGIHVVDSKGQFDTRDHHRTLTNFVQAGVAEDERLRIMERCRAGVIARAKAGLPWGPNLPAGRGFKRIGKNSGEWFITEQGEKLRRLLERYADGEPLRALAQEYGFHPAVVVRIVHGSQLSGTYIVTFNSPEIGITDLRIPVPAVPQVITPELEQRVLDRLAHNRICNKTSERKYLLTGFVRCSSCDRSLTAGYKRGGHSYAHYTNQSHRAKDQDCGYWGIPGDLLDKHVLGYLYGLFLDEPAYNKAVKAALPSDDDRKTLAKDIKTTEGRLAAADREIGNLVNAIAAGADVGLLLGKQNQLKAEKRALAIRLRELTETLAAMPDPQDVEEEATLLRLLFMAEYQGRDWRTLPYEEVRRFLHFLFGDNPRKSGNGIFVDRENNAWHITFKGRVEFYHDLVNGRPLPHGLEIVAVAEDKRLEVDSWLALWDVYKTSERTQKECGLSVDEAVQAGIKRSEQALKELGCPIRPDPLPVGVTNRVPDRESVPKPLMDNKSSIINSRWLAHPLRLSLALLPLPFAFFLLPSPSNG